MRPSPLTSIFAIAPSAFADGVEGRFVGLLPPLTDAEEKLH